MNRSICVKFLLTLIITFVFSSPVYSGKTEIKFAILAPEGSAWMNSVRAIDEDLKKKTDGDLSLKVYAGGSAGDEKDVIRKMKINQLHCAGFTGNGLGEILPMVRILELPMLFKDTKEIDYVTSGLRKRFEKEFEKKGRILLGWAEAGYVYIFSNKKILNLDDMQGIKMWVWEGDILAEESFRALNVSPIPLAFTDVMTALQTNMINAIYTSPIGAIALQWFTKVKYMTNLPLVNASGAILLNKRFYDKLKPEYQKMLREVVNKHLKDLVAKTREDNIESIKVLQENGIEVVDISEMEKEKMLNISKSVWKTLTDKLYPKDLLDETKKLIAQYRGESTEKTDNEKDKTEEKTTGKEQVKKAEAKTNNMAEGDK